MQFENRLNATIKEITALRCVCRDAVCISVIAVLSQHDHWSCLRELDKR